MDGLVKPVFALDFDGTITTHKHGYTGPVVEDAPLAGALAFLTDLAPSVQIVIFSARAETDENTQGIIDWLNENGFGELPVTITSKKPASAFVIFDDLGWHFDGTYPTVEQVLSFLPWWKTGKPSEFPPIQAGSEDDAVESLNTRATVADFDITETVTRTAVFVGGEMHDLDKRVKSPSSLAGKIANVMAEKGMTLAQAAADVKDALRYTIVFDASVYTAGVALVIDTLTRGAGLKVSRFRNYWSDEPIARYPAGAYVGVNAVMQTPNGYLFEVQFHTPQSVDVQALNWDFYKLIRSGAPDVDLDQVVGLMRENNQLVETPDGAGGLDSFAAVSWSLEASGIPLGTITGVIPGEVHYGPPNGRRPCAECSFYGAGMYGRCGMWDMPVEPTYSCDEWAYGQPVDGSHPEGWNPEPEAINVHLEAVTAALPSRKSPTRHETALSVNKAVQRGYKHAVTLEPGLVDALAAVFDRAADVAAERFEALATDHLRAAGLPDSTFCLPAEVRGVSDPVRQNFLKAVMEKPLADAGVAFDVTNPLTAQAFASTGKHIVHISQTTQLDVMKTVRASYKEGLSIQDTATAIRDNIRGASRTRATMIARTELAGAVNAGSLAAARTVESATGDTMTKVWMTAPGARYPRHEDYDGLDGQTRSLGELFDVGDDQLDHPGDPNGEPGEVINCRCAMSYNGGEPVEADSMDASAFLPDWWDESVEDVPRDPQAEIDEIERELRDNALTADAMWTAPAAEEILPVHCETPGTSSAMSRKQQMVAKEISDAQARIAELDDTYEKALRDGSMSDFALSWNREEKQYLESQIRDAAKGYVSDGPAQTLLDEEFSHYEESLTDEERAGLGSYRLEVGYKAINDYLRDGTIPEAGTFSDESLLKQRVEGLDSAIAKAPVTGEPLDVVVYRGVRDVRASLGENVRAGKIITDKGFTSTTTEVGVAVDYATSPVGGVVKILVPRGTRGAWMRGAGMEEDYADENREFVLPRDSRFEVVSVERGVAEQGRQPLITLRLLPPVTAPS